MAMLIKVNGVEVDGEDPCALWQALYSAKIKRLAGEQVEETEIRSPVSHRRIRIASASMADLDDELARLASACQAKNGGRRTRYAKTIRFI